MMRTPALGFVLLLSLVGSACNSASGGGATLLCHACSSDSDCGSNPCYVDKSGARFCGAPCTSCPSGYDCAAVEGTSGQVVKSCFPTSELCSSTVGSDLATSGADGDGLADLAGADFSLPACTTPQGGSVSHTGGTVDRLYFGYTGDTRPANKSASYPAALQTVANNIFTQLGQKGVEFAIDGGDHMEASTASQAAGNMASYQTAAAKLGKPVFMTMGNHECATSFDSQDCGYSGAASSDIKMSAFMSSLQNVSGQSTPYYRFDVMTSSGKAVFLVVADDAWNATQQAWLTAQLTDADANAKYTFVSKHHPDGNTDQPAFQQIYDLVTAHKYTLFMTGHSHEYKHPASNPRAVVMGLGGAPFDNPNQMWWGYLTVMQCEDDHIYVNAYDQATGNVMETFNVPPQ